MGKQLNPIKEFTHEDSLRTIDEMINLAKGKINENSFYFILWGWVILLASLGSFILLKIGYHNPHIAWSVVIIGVVASIVKGIQEGKSTEVSTHLDQIYNGIWIVFALNYILIFALAISQEKMEMINPLITILAGICTILSGVTIKFKPLIIGGIILWACGVLSFFIGEYQLLATSFGILVGYIIPGYLLKRKEA